ncbi:MAG: immunity protein YezG family protein [Thermoactinomyces sp.]
MDDAKLGKIYQQMAETIVEMIPEEWEKSLFVW